jgi:5-methylcytosine-specific restriction endonuclease McrA
MNYQTTDYKRAIQVCCELVKLLPQLPDYVQIDTYGMIWMQVQEDWICINGQRSNHSPKEKIARLRKIEDQIEERYKENSILSKVRQDVLTRDNNQCQVCSKSMKGLHIHHILPRHVGGGNELDNLITVCNKCHKTVEGKDFTPEELLEVKARHEW